MIQQEIWDLNNPTLDIIVEEQFVKINLIITIETRYKRRMMNDMWVSKSFISKYGRGFQINQNDLYY